MTMEKKIKGITTTIVARNTGGRLFYGDLIELIAQWATALASLSRIDFSYDFFYRFRLGPSIRDSYYLLQENTFFQLSSQKWFLPRRALYFPTKNLIIQQKGNKQ